MPSRSDFDHPDCQRRELPWVRVDKEYVFDTDDGPTTLPELFGGRSQLLVYHFVFGPEWHEGCTWPKTTATRRRRARIAFISREHFSPALRFHCA
jgi:predicted dithiol-disulfide oxidoreductase (DUF899 family)